MKAADIEIDDDEEETVVPDCPAEITDELVDEPRPEAAPSTVGDGFRVEIAPSAIEEELPADELLGLPLEVDPANAVSSIDSDEPIESAKSNEPEGVVADEVRIGRFLPAVRAAYAAILQLPADQKREAMRRLGREDRFFLLTVLCQRTDANRQWILDRCDEVQRDPWGYIDLWSRGHYKSTIITFAGTIQLLLNNPEATVGIFSHTRPIAKKFLSQIKRELESNRLLQDLYPEILFKNPIRESPRWSEDTGLIVKRKSNPREASLEAWGLVDGQPISVHFSHIIYDDIVTQDVAWSDTWRAKVLEALQMSFNLGSEGGLRTFTGTPYHAADPYAHIIKEGVVKARKHPCITVEGVPALLTLEQIEEKRREMGSVVFAAQMMLDPRHDTVARFKLEHLRYYEGQISGKPNTYIVVDAAASKEKSADFTAAWVISLAADQNYYVRWMIRDRLSLQERINLVMDLHRKWKPISVGYEKNSLAADIEMIRAEQESVGYRFNVIELPTKPSKAERIERLIPIVEAGRLYFPSSLILPVNYKDGERIDVIETFINEEWLQWSPVAYCAHDDGLDALSRIVDKALMAKFPRTLVGDGVANVLPFAPRRSRGAASSVGWMAI